MNYYQHHIGDFSDKTKISKLPVVYVITTQNLEFVKIGMTKSLKQRMNNIQSGCPFRLSLWLAIRTPNPKPIELYLHQRMNYCKTHGEWFSPNVNDLDFLADFFANTNSHVKEVYRALLQA